MYKLYKVDNTKKSYIKGLWKYKGKIYFNNLTFNCAVNYKDIQGDIDKLFSKGETSVFYITQEGYPGYDFTGYILNSQGNKKVLNNRLFLKRDKLSIKEIKSLLSKYSGMTIYNHKPLRGCYFIEIFY